MNAQNFKAVPSTLFWAIEIGKVSEKEEYVRKLGPIISSNASKTR